MSEPTLTVTQSGADPAPAQAAPTPVAPAAPTPSQEFIAKAKSEVIITDQKGRAIVLRKPGVLAQYRLVDMLGHSASNQAYMGMVLPLSYVGSIDGDDVSISTKRELEALIVRLDEGGIFKVAEAVQKHFGEQDPEADKETLKN
jgi:hypothetical protein